MQNKSTFKKKRLSKRTSPRLTVLESRSFRNKDRVTGMVAAKFQGAQRGNWRLCRVWGREKES